MSLIQSQTVTRMWQEDEAALCIWKHTTDALYKNNQSMKKSAVSFILQKQDQKRLLQTEGETQSPALEAFNGLVLPFWKIDTNLCTGRDRG